MRTGDVPVVSDDPDADRQFADLLDARAIDMSFQPMLDLHSGQVVAFEAMAQGPEGGPFAGLGALLAAARRADRVAEFDWACRAAAFTAFLDAGIPPSVSLFINVEPEAITSGCPADLFPIVARAESRLRVFVEVSGRTLAADPAAVLAAADRARELGWGVAIDKVGSVPAPIAMLPIVAPDVVKLDLRRLNEADPSESAAIISSVLRHIERTGAALVVEGIEAEEDAQWARVLGATYGQGPHLGRSGPLPAAHHPPRSPIPLIKAASTDLQVASPFELFEGGALARSSTAHLDRLGTVLAHGARLSGCPSVFLICIGTSDRVPADLLTHGLPEDALVFVLFGADIPPQPAPGARGVRLPAGDTFLGEEFLIVLGDHAPVALFARAAAVGLYDVAITQDFELVHEIARHIIRRVPPSGPYNTALGGSGAEEEPLVPDSDTDESTAKRGWRGWRRGD